MHDRPVLIWPAGNGTRVCREVSYGRHLDTSPRTAVPQRVHRLHPRQEPHDPGRFQNAPGLTMEPPR